MLFVGLGERKVPEQHENRRVQMTRRLMKDALLELLEETELANITVTAVCERADVHRSTFYKYYADPSELLREIEKDFLHRIPVPPETLDQKSQEDLIAAAAAFFDSVRKNSKAVRTLFSQSAGDDFASRMVDYLCDGYIPIGTAADPVAERLTRLYIANGTVGMLREWVIADCPGSSRRLAEMMYFLSRKVIS